MKSSWWTLLPLLSEETPESTGSVVPNKKEEKPEDSPHLEKLTEDSEPREIRTTKEDLPLAPTT